jgi:2'-5' RNA ligase
MYSARGLYFLYYLCYTGGVKNEWIIVLPTRPQPDTIGAIFLLQKFGGKKLSGIESASIEVRPQLGVGETFESLLTKNILALDLGGGPLDHHGSDYSTTELVAKYLGVQNDKSLQQILAYANRDDKEGKGTISRDPLDRAFGLSGLISALNKTNPKDAAHVVYSVLPLLDAHWKSAQEHHVELPAEVASKRLTGLYEEFTVEHAGKSVLVSCVVSDKPAMPTYLRSLSGPRADVVVQKSEVTNHLCVLTKQERKVDLSVVAALIRLREGEIIGADLGNDVAYLGQTGRLPEVEHWYYDPATNSLLNGGSHSDTVEPSRIDWDEFKKIVHAGLEAVVPAPFKEKPSNFTPSYYLSLNIPSEVSEEILSNLKLGNGLKAADKDNLHITLEFFGQKTDEEAQKIANSLAAALAGRQEFAMVLDSAQLATGSPEGYTNTKAWYLDMDETEGAEEAHAVRLAALESVGLPARDKALHVTVASARDRKAAAEAEAVFSGEFRMKLPVSEVVLMQSFEDRGKRGYKPHTTFQLSK